MGCEVTLCGSKWFCDDVVIQSIFLYYKVQLQYHKVLLQYHKVLFQYYKVLFQYYSVLQSTTPVLLLYYKVLLQYYKVLFQYYSVLQSTVPVLFCTTKFYSGTALFWKLQHFVRLSIQISPNTAPATKSDSLRSPSAAPATKSHTATSPNASPATKSETPTSPNTAPATENDSHDWSCQLQRAEQHHSPSNVSKYCACHKKWHCKIIKCCACHEKWHCNSIKCCTCHDKRLVTLLSYWAVTLLSCYFTELWPY